MTCNCNNNCCTHLVSSIVLDETAGTYVLSFDSVPTVKDGSKFKFRIPCNITTVATPNVPLTANVSINSTITAVPLWDCIGNVLTTGTTLKTRTVYVATFGNNPNHVLVEKAKCHNV